MEEISKCGIKTGKSKAKRIEVWKDDVYINTYSSMEELVLNSVNDFGVQFLKSKVSNVCNGKRKIHQGYIFKFEKKENKV